MFMSFSVPVNFAMAGTTRSALAEGWAISGSAQQIKKRHNAKRTLA